MKQSDFSHAAPPELICRMDADRPILMQLGLNEDDVLSCRLTEDAAGNTLLRGATRSRVQRWSPGRSWRSLDPQVLRIQKQTGSTYITSYRKPLQVVK